MAEGLPERLTALIPADNPLYNDFRAWLTQIPRQGKGSAMPSVLGQLALLGWWVQNGMMVPGGGGQGGDMPAQLAQAGKIDLRQIALIRSEIDKANEWDFET